MFTNTLHKVWDASKIKIFPFGFVLFVLDVLQGSLDTALEPIL